MRTRKALLGDVCAISMGQAPAGDSYNTANVGLPLIAGAGDFGKLTPEPSKFTSAPTKVSRPNDLILCIRATIGDRNWADKEYCLGRGVAGLRGRETILNQRYLWHWLGHIAPQLKAKGRGATFLQVSKADIASLEISLPPLPEQRRIATILDKVDDLVEKRRTSISMLDQLLNSVFNDMFGDPVTNPKGWSTASLGEIGEFENGDRSSNYPSQDDIATNGIPFLSTRNIKNNNLSFEDGVQFITEKKFRSLSRGKLKRGDLIITLRGTLGSCCVFDNEFETGFINAQMMIIRPYEKVLGDFLHSMLVSDSFHQYLKVNFTGAAVPQLTSSGMSKLTLIVPPIALQTKFVAIKKQVQAVRRSKHNATLLEEALVASIQTRAFEETL